jgi:hypothetical protein
MAIAAILIFAYGWGYIFGQVEVKQSVTTNDCQMRTGCNQTGMTVTNEHGHIKIYYCVVKCHAVYILTVADNGTMTEVKK